MNWLKKIFILILLGFVVLALFFLYAGKDKASGRKFLYQDDNHGQYVSGDLFNYCEVEQFKEKIKETKLQESRSFDGVDIMIMGDSFFNTGFDSQPVPNYLEKITGRKVFYRATSKSEITPLRYLEQLGHQKDEAKIFIWETAERKSVERGLALQSDFIDINKNNSSSESSITRWSSIQHSLFDRVDVEYFIKNNFIFKPINLWLKNKAFDWLGDINDKTPVYSNNPKMLFFDEEVNFNEDKSKLDLIGKIADNISREAKLMKDKYNLTLVYLIIPNKLSIYGSLVSGGRAYDDFIPKLQRALEDRDVRYINIYKVFDTYRQRHPDKMLYYAGDTHYTPLGKELLINELIELVH